MRDPRAAYAEWLRVVRPGGKILIFDANWYRYLVDDRVAQARQADQENNNLEGWDEASQATSAEEKALRANSRETSAYACFASRMGP